jgi:RimJ/RimL family protein N-acetyltransferase
MPALVQGWRCPVMLTVVLEVGLLLRDVEPADVEVYVRMRCDPAMMADLGGPLPGDGIEAKLATDVRNTRDDTYWVSMIVPDPAAPELVAGTVGLWSHEEIEGAPLSEIGWMVLPEYQGRGLAKVAVRAMLERAHADGRWGVVHAFPGIHNAASNALCRTVGFTLVGERVVTFADGPSARTTGRSTRGPSATSAAVADADLPWRR